MAGRCPHCGEALDPDRRVHYAGYVLDETTYRLWPESDPTNTIKFTSTQTQFLSTLMRGQGKVKSRMALWNEMYAHRPEEDWADFKIVDVILCKIRKMLYFRKFEIAILTVWGSGYHIAPGLQPVSPAMGIPVKERKPRTRYSERRGL